MFHYFFSIFYCRGARARPKEDLYELDQFASIEGRFFPIVDLVHSNYTSN